MLAAHPRLFVAGLPAAAPRAGGLPSGGLIVAGLLHLFVVGLLVAGAALDQADETEFVEADVNTIETWHANYVADAQVEPPRVEEKAEPAGVALARADLG